MDLSLLRVVQPARTLRVPEVCAVFLLFRRDRGRRFTGGHGIASHRLLEAGRREDERQRHRRRADLFVRAVPELVARFRADRMAPDVRARVLSDAAFGERRGVKATPTVFINGTQLRAGFTKEKLEAAIEAALAPKKKS